MVELKGSALKPQQGQRFPKGCVAQNRRREQCRQGISTCVRANQQLDCRRREDTRLIYSALVLSYC